MLSSIVILAILSYFVLSEINKFFKEENAKQRKEFFKKRIIFFIASYKERFITCNEDDLFKDSLKIKGFLHCYFPHQIPDIIKNCYQPEHNKETFVLLEINKVKVKSPIIYEGSDAEIFPHIYGPLNIDAIIKTHPIEFDKNGEFIMPDYPSIELEFLPPSF